MGILTKMRVPFRVLFKKGAVLFGVLIQELHILQRALNPKPLNM